MSQDHHPTSRYTYRQLQLLRHSSTASPFRVVAHIDLDAFYAQSEMVRLGTPRTTPLAVRQWDSLIAVNYPARDFGITRMISAGEARKLCPDLVLQHVATFREGQGGKWAYRDDAFKNVGSDKVSLDPYRAESRKILQSMREEVGRWHAKVTGNDETLPPASIEKASIDEVFIDLSPLVLGVLLQRYPEVRAERAGENRDLLLPCPPTSALEWSSDNNLVDLDENEAETDDPDWDDFAMLVGSEIIRSVRAAVWDQLHYTCSAGIARNKMMAKLGSGRNKPNKQTVVRNRAVQNFLGGFKFTKIRMLGGKLGDQVTAHFGTEQVSDLLNVSLEQFRAKLDDDTANWLYGIIRGEDRSEVNPRTQMKSMLSAKSFRPSINSTEQAEKWLHIFAADIYNRLVEDGLLENRRRPKTVALHHRQGAQFRSRQLPIPGAKSVDEATIFELGKSLFRQVNGDGRVWPCSNLSLSVGGFEDGVTNNRAIDKFLVRGQQVVTNETPQHAAEDHELSGDISGEPQVQPLPTAKRRKVDGGGIRRFFTNRAPATDSPIDPLDDPQQCAAYAGPGPASTLEPMAKEEDDNLSNLHEDLFDPSGEATPPPGVYVCSQCKQLTLEDERIEHEDWHFAKELERQERLAAASTGGISSTSLSRPNNGTGPSSNARSRGGRSGRGKTEKGQMRLTFG